MPQESNSNSRAADELFSRCAKYLLALLATGIIAMLSWLVIEVRDVRVEQAEQRVLMEILAGGNPFAVDE